MAPIQRPVDSIQKDLYLCTVALNELFTQISVPLEYFPSWEITYKKKVENNKHRSDTKKISLSAVKSLLETTLPIANEMMNSASSSQLAGSSHSVYAPQSNPNALGRRAFPTSAAAAVVTTAQQAAPMVAASAAGSQAPNNSGAQSPNRCLFGNSGLRGIFPMTPIMNIAQMKQRQQVQNAAPGMPSSSLGNSMPFHIGRLQHTGENNAQPAPFELEFPSLGNRVAGAMSSNNSLAGPRNYAVGVMSKTPTENATEFQIQLEEFPALPGKSKMNFVTDQSSSSQNDSNSKTPISMLASSSYDGTSNDTKLIGDKTGNNQRKGIQTHPDGAVTNIPPGMVTDQFGMVGLLTFIRAAETDPNLVALAPGIDLTTLGLNLNSPENLYSTFQSPWADTPCRPQDIDFHVPLEYLTNIFIREKLAPFKLNRYGENLLFFLFYMNGGDVLQLAAASELYNRNWRYHREEKVWITRAVGMDATMKTNTFERGTYYFFDAQNWRKVMKQFHLDYDKLEDRPQLQLESIMQQQQQQQSQSSSLGATAAPGAPPH